VSLDESSQNLFIQVNYNFHKIIERPKSLMDKNDLKIKKQENDNLQEIFYKGSSKKGTY